jgi:hypothetical protein
MAGLTKFRLINVEGVGRLSCELGSFALEQIDDNVAAHLYGSNSRYVEKIKFEVPTQQQPSVPLKKVRSKKV